MDFLTHSLFYFTGFSKGTSWVSWFVASTARASRFLVCRISCTCRDSSRWTVDSAGGTARSGWAHL